MSVSFPTKCFLFHKFIPVSSRNIQVFEYHAQNLNTPQNNSASWDLQLGFNSVFKGLKLNKRVLGLTLATLDEPAVSIVRVYYGYSCEMSMNIYQTPQHQIPKQQILLKCQ
jgi:hypothetical protein